MHEMYRLDKRKYFDDFNPVNPPEFNWWPDIWQLLMPGVGLNLSMGLLSLMYLSNDEQKEKWVPMCRTQKWWVCYGQTEIGHGSNVAGLLTTATLDKETDEFVINTPCDAAAKFWPGDLGYHSTHAVVMARLLIGELDYGT
jgi:acyl-CoA oxidase